MTREEAIKHIESLYPTDSASSKTAQIGAGLLYQAQQEVHGWRTQPTEILIRYAQLCIAKESSC